MCVSVPLGTLWLAVMNYGREGAVTGDDEVTQTDSHSSRSSPSSQSFSPVVVSLRLTGAVGVR